jgi:hypothetical protein
VQRTLIHQMDLPVRDALRFDERFGMIVDSEWTERENRRMTTAMPAASTRPKLTHVIHRMKH